MATQSMPHGDSAGTILGRQVRAPTSSANQGLPARPRKKGTNLWGASQYLSPVRNKTYVGTQVHILRRGAPDRENPLT